jgi:hypothetical protein
VHKRAVLHLRGRQPKVVPVRAVEARKVAVAGAEAALSYTPLQPVRRT